jgi:hypothetical protein
MDHNQIQTWPVHSYDISTNAISTLYMHPNKSLRAETKHFFKRDNSVKKFILPRPNLNLTYVILWCIHISNWNSMCATNAEIMNRNWKFLFFLKFKWDNSVKNQWTITKFELDLRIPMSIYTMSCNFNLIRAHTGPNFCVATCMGADIYYILDSHYFCIMYCRLSEST